MEVQILSSAKRGKSERGLGKETGLSWGGEEARIGE